MGETDWITGGGSNASHELTLSDGSRVAVIGSGPSGSFFTYFLLDMAERVGLELEVDVYEPRDFTKPAPFGCNMCGGIISESLVQNLATEGINLPPTVVQRGIDSYVLHMDVGTVRIDTPLHEKRIGAVHRGPGPRDITEVKWESFDHHLQQRALAKGARLINGRVTGVELVDGRPHITVRNGLPEEYDLAAVTIGINSPALKLFQGLGIGYEAPRGTKTFIREYYVGAEEITEVLGGSMHVFLLKIPRLEFAAVVPKGEYVSICLLGDDIDSQLISEFMNAPELKACMPPDWDFEGGSCQCSPKINVAGSPRPFAGRMVFIGDCGVTRLYKGGIGAAYKTAKAAATTAVFEGVSETDFRNHYFPACKKINRDNALGRVIFATTRLLQTVKFARRTMLHMTSKEQKRDGKHRRMSQLLWDTFTGSAPYKDIFLSMLHPAFMLGMLASVGGAMLSIGRKIR